MEVVAQFLPLMIMQSVHALVVYLCEKRWRRNPTGRVLLALIPLIGFFYVCAYYAGTLMKLIERVQVLTAKLEASTFD